MACYLDHYNDFGSLLSTVKEFRTKLARAADPRDVQRLTRKLDEATDLLHEAVSGLPNSPYIEQVLDEICFSSLTVLVEEVRELRGKLRACETKGRMVDAGRITRELAPLEAAMGRICDDACSDSSVADLQPLSASRVADPVCTSAFLKKPIHTALTWFAACSYGRHRCRFNQQNSVDRGSWNMPIIRWGGK